MTSNGKRLKIVRRIGKPEGENPTDQTKVIKQAQIKFTQEQGGLTQEKSITKA